MALTLCSRSDGFESRPQHELWRPCPERCSHSHCTNPDHNMSYGDRFLTRTLKVRVLIKGTTLVMEIVP